MKSKIAAALLLTFAACTAMLVFSTTAVAQYVTEVTIKSENTGLPRVKATNWENIAVTVKNLGAAPIDNVRIYLPGWPLGAKITADPVPGWNHHTFSEVDNNIVEWSGAKGEDQIAVGATKTFRFTKLSPSTAPYENTYELRVVSRLVDIGFENRPVEILVDGKVPTITVTVTPAEVSTAPAVAQTITIKVVASEKLRKLDNVFVVQHLVDLAWAMDNADVTMTSVDNITWTGTYTLRENADNWLQFDGPAYVFVAGDNTMDLAFNKSANENKAFYVDSIAPPAPTISAIPTPENKDFTIKGTASDNRDGSVASVAGLKVEVIVAKDENKKATTYSLSDGAFGVTVRKELLAQGPNTIGLRVTDVAGNKWENLTYATVFFDNVKPTVTPLAPVHRGRGLTGNKETAVQFPEKRKRIEIKVEDPVPGTGFDNTKLENIRVALDKPPYTPLAGWENARWKWDNVRSVLWNENDLEYGDNWYRVIVTVRDNLNWENKWFLFKRDNSPPPAATQTLTIPTIGRGLNVALSGTADYDYGGSIIISFRDNKTGAPIGTPVEIAVGTADNYSYTIPELPHATTVRPDALAGRVNIVLKVVDQAGNSSPENVLPPMLVDRYVPRIAIAGPIRYESPIGLASVSEIIPTKYTTTDTMVRIWGTVTDNYSGVTTVNVGGVVTTLGPGGEFSVVLSLMEGENPITISAEDGVPGAERNTVGLTLTVVRTVPPWALIAVVVAIVAVLLAAIAVLRRR